MPIVGGNSLKATGGMNAADTKYQEALGITDSGVDEFIEDTMNGGHQINDRSLVPGWHLEGNRFRIRLNTPTTLELNRVENVAYVELGNPGLPHAVREYRGDLWADSQQLRPEMEALRHHPAFPKGANVNYYSFISDTEVRVLTFERGVEDFTLACGTGCGSVAAVLWKQGKLPGGALTLQNKGGTLNVRVEGENGTVTALYQEGPTEITEILDWNG